MDVVRLYIPEKEHVHLAGKRPCSGELSKFRSGTGDLSLVPGSNEQMFRLACHVIFWEAVKRTLKVISHQQKAGSMRCKELLIYFRDLQSIREYDLRSVETAHLELLLPSARCCTGLIALRL